MRLLALVSISIIGFLVSVSVPSSLAEVVDFPVGLDARWQTITAQVDQDAFDPGREKPSVLIISQLPPESFEYEQCSISWVLSPSPRATFPPGLKRAYMSGQQYLWRWVLMFAPDVVVTEHQSLAAALSGRVPCVPSLDLLPEVIEPSPLHAELKELAARTPIEIGVAVAEHYGHQLDSIGYIPALAMIGRSRLARLDGAEISDELAAIANQAPEQKTISGPVAAGHLIFAELGIKDRVIAAAESAAKSPGDNQMSDSVFMICPLLAAAGRLGEDGKFFEVCIDHLQRMQRLCLREDGLYRHSPLDDAAWGRGNGFPAIGLAWALSEMPESVAGRQEVLEDFQQHIEALSQHQDASGMWHQVIDHPESYREFTSTCMITFAILRGMREGWLDKEIYQSVADRGWEAVKLRISLDGKSFTDACAGTGKQKSLKDYFRRTAILGPDERSGAMALMLATERAMWEKAAAAADAGDSEEEKGEGGLGEGA